MLRPFARAQEHWIFFSKRDGAMMEPEPKTAPVETKGGPISVSISLTRVEDVTNGAPPASDAPEMPRQAPLEAEACAPEPAAEEPSQDVVNLAFSLRGGTPFERIERVRAAYRFGRFDRDTANRIQLGEERGFRVLAPIHERGFEAWKRGGARFYAILRANLSDFAIDKDVAATAAWTKKYATYLRLVQHEHESQKYDSNTVSRRFRTLAEAKAYYAGSGIPLPVEIE